MFKTTDIDNLYNDTILSSHIYITNQSDMKQLSGSIWELINKIYNESGLELKSFINANDMLDRSYFWKLIYSGELNNLDDFKPEFCYSIGIYKNLAGIKRVASGINRLLPYNKAIDAWKKLVISDFKVAWTECSGSVESKLMKYGGDKFIIDPTILSDNGIISNIEILDDNIHYRRKLHSGIEVVKLAVGTCKI